MPIENLPQLQIPQWLSAISEGSASPQFCLGSILEDSCFYPGSCLDGTPIKFMADNLYSFIYVDFNITKAELERDLFGNGPAAGFRGYTCVRKMEIDQGAIKPKGWVPGLGLSPAERMRFAKAAQKLDPQEFLLWTVWRHECSGRMFSLLYIKEEASCCYDALYNRTKRKPLVLTMIEPTNRWLLLPSCDNPSEPNSVFVRTVRKNPSGMPTHVLQAGGWDTEDVCAPWLPEYERVSMILDSTRTGNRNLSLARLKAAEHRVQPTAACEGIQ